MTTQAAAIAIVAAFVAALIHWGVQKNVQLAVAFGLGLLVALLIVAAGPRVLGG
jgi:hypothetical protein